MFFHIFGVLLAQEKTECPVTVLKFLGIIIDTDRMEYLLPIDKLEDLKEVVAAAVGRSKIQLRELQSVLGKLNFACRIMLMGRVFCRSLAASTAGVTAPHHFVRLGREHRDDVKVWAVFLDQYNGRSF